MELETQNQEIVEAANQAVEQKQSKAAKIMQFATDATRMLSTTADSLQKIKETGFIDRIISLFPGKKKKPANEITKEEFEELKQFAWSSLEAMNQRELLTADALITVKNNLNSLVVEQNDIKEAITQMAQKVADRFSNLENRVEKVESSQNLETWVSNLKYDDAYENVPEAIKFLKVVKGFYLNKQGDYTSNEIKSLKRALDNVGFDFRAKISLEKLLDDLIEELQTFDEQKYLQITKVELPDGKIPSAKELANTLAVPSFVAVCSLPENKKLLEDAVEDLREDLGISYEKALQRVVKRRIAKTNGIDLSVETSLFDLGIELISCYSAAPELFGISEDNSAKVASIESSSTNSSYQTTGILEGIDLDALVEEWDEFDFETLLKVEEKTHNPVIQCAIGKDYYFGLEDDDGNVLVEEDKDEAKKWIEKAAKQNYGEAYSLLAIMFYEYPENIEYLKKGLDCGNEECNELLFNEYYKHDAFNECIEYVEKANEYIKRNGSVRELGFFLGRYASLYQYGDGFSQDYTKAVTLYKQGVELGDSYSEYQLAILYVQGNGVPKDLSKSIDLLMDSAGYNYDCNGFDEAIAVLAYCFYDGIGVEENLNEAKRLFEIAAKMGNEYAKNQLETLFTSIR